MARKTTRREWGKVRTLPSGRRQASYLGPDGLRYNAAMTYDNETDARAWLASVRSEIARGVWVSPAERAEQKAQGDRTLADYAKAWLSERTNARGDHLRPRTQAEYRRLLDGPLADLGATPLGSITPAKVRAAERHHGHRRGCPPDRVQPVHDQGRAGDAHRPQGGAAD